jgi:hypothetical protein
VPLDDAFDFEHVQALRQRAGADAGARVLQLCEAARALGEIVDEQRCPFRPDQVRSRRDRARSAVVNFHHPALGHYGQVYSSGRRFRSRVQFDLRRRLQISILFEAMCAPTIINASNSTIFARAKAIKKPAC